MIDQLGIKIETEMKKKQTDLHVEREIVISDNVNEIKQVLDNRI